MYKDKEREANRLAQARFKAKQILAEQGITPRVLPNRPERTAQGNIRVSKPGDDDYEPQCETTRKFIGSPPKVQDVISELEERKQDKDRRTVWV